MLKHLTSTINIHTRLSERWFLVIFFHVDNDPNVALNLNTVIDNKIETLLCTNGTAVLIMQAHQCAHRDISTYMHKQAQAYKLF